jgi:PAS domain S-box-containing protein
MPAHSRTSKTPFSIRRAIVVGYVIALAIICFFALYTYLNMQEATRDNQRINEAMRTLRVVESIYHDVQSIESGQRGYILAGQKQFLESYSKGLDRLVKDSTDLVALPVTDPQRKTDVQRLLNLVSRKVSFAKMTVKAREEIGKESAETHIRSAEGRLLMDSITGLIGKMETEDRLVLNNHYLHRDQTARQTVILFFVLAGLFIVFLLSFILLVRRDIKRRLHVELDSQVTEKTIAIKDILDRISDGVVAFDKNWHYVYMNDKAVELTGRLAKDVIGRNVWEVAPDHVGNAFYKAYHQAMDKQEYIFLEAYYPRFDRWYENHIYPSPGGLTVHFRDITEKKKTETKLAQAVEKFNFAARATNDVVWEADLANRTLWWNENFYEKFGYVPGEIDMSDTSWEAYLHPDDKERVLKTVINVLADPKQTIWNDEYRFAKADGSYLNIYDRCYILRDANGKAYKMIGSMADVTPLFKTKQELRETEERYKTLVDAIDGIVWEVDAATFQFHFVSRQAERLLGYPLEEWTNTPGFWEAHIHPDDRKWAMDFCLRATHEKRTHEFEYRMIAADGKVVWLHDIVSVVEEEGRPTLLRGLMVDITERKIAQEAIQQSEEKYRTLVEQATDGIFIADQTGRFVVVNSSGMKLSQYSMDELMHMTIYHLAEPEDLRNNPFHFAEMTGEHGARTERKMVKKDGSVIDIEVNAKFLSDGRFLAFIRDITERKKAQEEINKARDLSDKLIDSLPGVFYFYDETGKFIRWNKQFEIVTEYLGEEIAQMHPIDFFEDEEKNIIIDCIERVLAEGVSNVQANFVTKHNRKIPYFFKAVLLNYEGKRCILGNGIDITERIEAEEKLQESLNEIRELTDYVQNVREEERSHMAREIHDELGQQLTVLKMDVSWLNKKIASGDEVIRQKIRSLTDMLDGTVRTVRRISSELRPSVLDDLGLVAAIDWNLKEFGRRSGLKIVFTEPGREVKLPDAVKTGLFRIFQESLTNVARHSGAQKVEVSLQQTNGHFILSIEDDGKGFDTLNRTFKTLGILGMKERTAMMGGTYEINSSPGKGTIITVSVPNDET